MLAEAITKARINYKFRIIAYVFMPNHVHLLIEPQFSNYSISKILQAIKQSVSRKILISFRKRAFGIPKEIKTAQKTKPFRFWQAGGGYDRNIISEDILVTSAYYIHNNPVRKGLAKTAQDWYWSSAADWQGLRKGPIPIDMQCKTITPKASLGVPPAGRSGYITVRR
jgi:putative transposase